MHSHMYVNLETHDQRHSYLVLIMTSSQLLCTNITHTEYIYMVNSIFVARVFKPLVGVSSTVTVVQAHNTVAVFVQARASPPPFCCL